MRPHVQWAGAPGPALDLTLGQLPGRTLGRVLGLVMILGAVSFVTPAWAQQRNSRPQVPAAAQEAAALEAQLKEARGLLRLGQLQEAIDLLARTHESAKTSTAVIQMYGQALQMAGRRDDALALYRASLADADNPTQLYVEVERIHREAGELSDAFAICLEYHARFGDRGRWVANEMESLIRSDKMGLAAVEMIEAALKERPEDDDLHDLHVTALFFSGQSERALEIVTELDRTREARGNTLFRYAELVAQKNGYDDAVLAIDRALAAGPQPARREEMLYTKAQVLRRARRLEASLGAFDVLTTEFADGRYARRSLLEKADILAHELNRKEDALVAYRAVLGTLDRDRSIKARRVGDEVRLAMADCELSLGRPGEAGNLYSALADSSADPEVQVAAVFQVGEMYFYQSRMTEAEAKYYELVDNYKASDWMNDALERILLIGSNNDYGGVPLAALAQAEYQRRLGKVRRGLEILEEALVNYPESMAVDDLLLRKVDFSLALADIETAHRTAEQLAASFPDSELAPRGFMSVARHFASVPGAETEARGLFMEVLLRFPESIEAPEARAALEDLDRRDESRLQNVDTGKETG